MMQFLMAAALFLLAGARIPALLRSRSDLVFTCAVYGGVGSLLMSPVVYVPVDTALGGMNLVKLVLNSLMIVSLGICASPHTPPSPRKPAAAGPGGHAHFR